jgi:hypothetical protein
MDTVEKRRGQCRYTRHDKLFVQLLVVSEKVDVSKVTLLCHSCDASINGLKIEIDRELPVDRPVDLWMEFDGLDKKFYLRGHICWCCESADSVDLYQLGVELEDAHATDYTDWIELLANFSD